MKIIAFLGFAALAAADFSCIKPVNPIPAGPPGACCPELDQSFLLSFLYTGKQCKLFIVDLVQLPRSQINGSQVPEQSN